MQHTSRPVISNQPGPHHDVARRVARALAHPLRKPIADHTRRAFEQADAWRQQHSAPLILDAGCGVGLSTRRIAIQFPHHSVIGVDRSEDRLGREHGELPENALLVDIPLLMLLAIARHRRADRWCLWHLRHWTVA